MPAAQATGQDLLLQKVPNILPRSSIDNTNQREKGMGARSKLNTVAALGCLVLAAIIGGASGSWAVFATVLVVALGLSLCSRDIRLGRRDKS